MSADPARAGIDARLLEWMSEPQWRRDDERFRSLALELFAHQFEHCEPYRRFCVSRQATPDRVEDWREIPAVPTGAFKELRLACFPPERTSHVFLTSGTATSQRGSLHLDTLEVYEASLTDSFHRQLLPDLAAGQRIRIEVLAAGALEAPDSSLSHMFEVAVREFGSPESRFAVEGGKLRVPELQARLREDAHRGDAILICGTAFAFVHLLEALGERRMQLPPGSRAMETGGFKGHARALPRAELYAALAAGLGIPETRIVNQYGMTELGSQFYDSVLSDPTGPRRKLEPPWTRLRILDPASGDAVTPGEIGSISVLDLSNSGSVCALQTADLGRSAGEGFEILGREEGAEARGCSIAVDLLLSEGAR
ncbi:MAG: long-chain fatty acid--CoA ligase [Myxococcales bacterium]|nr:long-chain fatty acid--CoA ligase [Myxococcales bacterium]